MSGICNEFLPAKTDLFSNIRYERGQIVRYRDAPVYMLLVGRGNALEIHIAADGREGRRGLRNAVACLPGWLESSGIECEMLIATATKQSVINLARKCQWLDAGVTYIGSKGGFAHIFVMPMARH